MNSSIEMPVLISVAAVWIAIHWIANRLTFESPLGMVLGRLAIALGVGLVGGFLVSGIVSEISLSALSQSTSVPKESIRASGYSTFAAAVFGALFGAFTGIMLGLWRGISDYRQYLSHPERTEIKKGVSPIQETFVGATQVDELGRHDETGSPFPVWLLALLLFGAAIYFLTLGVQTDPVNVFGQECKRAYSTTQRIGGICLRSEWLAFGAVLLVLSFLLGFRRNARRN